MGNHSADRRSFLKRMVAVVGGLAAVPMLSNPALAARSHWRGWGGSAYGYRRPGLRGGYGGYGLNRGLGGYYGGYGGYGGYGSGLYNSGYYGVPYGGGLYSPGYGGFGGYGYPGYGGYGVGIPMLKREKPRAIDALSMLEC